MHNEEQSVQSEKYRKSLISLHIAVMLFGLSAVLGQFVTAPAVIVAGGRGHLFLPFAFPAFYSRPEPP